MATKQQQVMGKYELSPYLFSFQYKDGNDLWEARKILCFSKNESIRLAKLLMSESLNNDLHKIKTRKIYE
jgi:hypothetical protein